MTRKTRFLKKAASLALATAMTTASIPSANAATISYVDVPETAWYYDTVMEIVQEGYMTGTSSTTFEPTATLTRGMFVTVLGRIANVDTDEYRGSSSFLDVAADQWYSPYVSWASFYGITSGVGDGKFGVNDPVTREQMATFIARYASTMEVSLTEAEDPVTEFKDIASVSSWATSSLELMRKTGIISGDENGNFNPKQSATRAEAATVFTRLVAAASVDDDSTPVESPEPSESAEPSASLEPSESPAVSESPDVVESPEPSDSVEFSESVEPTETVQPSTSPAPSEEPDTNGMYTVRFYVNGTSVGVYSLKAGAKLRANTMDMMASLSGESIAAWYTDDAMTQRFLSGTTVNANLNLYGKVGEKEEEPSVSPEPSTEPSPEPSESPEPESTPLIPTEETHSAPAGAYGPNVAYHTISEIQSYAASHPADLYQPVTYATEPSLSGVYSPGVLSDETQNSALNMLNQCRYIAGLGEVTLSSSLSEYSSAATFLNYLNSTLTHTPVRPAALASSTYDELYNTGSTGASMSNLGFGYACLNTGILYDWIGDSDNDNISTLGHRRWALNPSMTKTGFGVTGYYYGMYACDQYKKESEIYTVWPAQTMPSDYFNANDAWSIMTGAIQDEDSIEVTLVRCADNHTWTFSSSSADGLFYVSNKNWREGCIIFRPSDLDSTAAGEVFHVTVTGLANGKTLYYTVRFFDLDETTYSSTTNESLPAMPSSSSTSSTTTLPSTSSSGTSNDSADDSECTVNYYLDDTLLETVHLQSGDLLTAPTIPSIRDDGYELYGWYSDLDPDNITQYDFTASVTASFNLYAYYIAPYGTTYSSDELIAK